jgi:hypothetical protein
VKPPCAYCVLNAGAQLIFLSLKHIGKQDNHRPTVSLLFDANTFFVSVFFSPLPAQRGVPVH